jgi:hypothetical protein
MRESLSRPEQDEYGTSQTSIRHHPPKRSAMRLYAVAPIHTGGVALRHVGPRDATWVPPSILPAIPSNLVCFATPSRPASESLRRWASVRTGVSSFTLPLQSGQPVGQFDRARHPIPGFSEASAGPGGEGPSPASHRPRTWARRLRPARPRPGQPVAGRQRLPT